ncbi:hypothetical protein LPJ61_000342 [Coemansia biformis]|uniref:Mus7/MMS22 family-domain-containing protein n=1 Tax=Coemansia biformis TaxID=1286918 RepID=A0A9W7YH97_9FUNG|nr:hypothetical protein LPJ61_000342 [Coemansia biformis]
MLGSPRARSPGVCSAADSAPTEAAASPATPRQAAEGHADKAPGGLPGARLLAADIGSSTARLADAESDAADWPSSGSETLDVAHIIQASNVLRSRLSRAHGARRRPDSDAGDSDCSMGSYGAADRGIWPEPAAAGDAEPSGEPQVRQPDAADALLRWNPMFLDGSQPAENPDGGASGQCGSAGSAGSFYASLLASAERSYPLRKRSEKNLHPYTRLVWTNPDELRKLRNARREMPAVGDSQPADGGRGAGDSRPYGDQEDSEDEDYVPGSPEPAADNSQHAAPDWEAAQLRSPHVQRGLTYRHLAARRRQTVGGQPPGKQHAIGPGGHSEGAAQRAQRWHEGPGTRDRDELPSVSSLLGAGPNDAADPFAFPDSGELRTPDLAEYAHRDSHILDGRHREANDQSMDQLSSPLEEPRALLADATSQPLESPAVDPSHSPGSAHRKRRRLLSRRHLTHARAGERDDGTSSASSAELLPTTRARRLDALSRRQIRGILPFSFMRELDCDRQGEIDEEVRRWRRQGRGGSARRLALPSSSPDRPAAIPGSQERNEPGSDVSMGDEMHRPGRPPDNDVAMLFADPVSPGHHRDSGAQPLFRFNFVDMYEWQYPPLAPVELTGVAPDFLRVAARECRRRGIRAKAQHDDPALKAISIEPRSTGDDTDDDVAQGIVLAWRMGVIDIRRVYFNDDEDSDELDVCRPYGEPSDGDDWPQGTPAAADRDRGILDPILISDDEAAEDNGGYDRAGGGHRVGHSRRRLKPPVRRAERHKRQGRPESSAGPRSQGGPRDPRSLLMRQPAAEQRRTAHATLPAARGLDAVMHEFTELDSDADDRGGSNMDIGACSRLPPSLLKQHAARRSLGHARREQFVALFAQQHRRSQQRRGGSSGRRRDAGRSHAGPTGRQSYFRVAGGRRVPATLPATAQAEFLFDDDCLRAGGHGSPARPRGHQTRLLTGRLSTASSVHMRGPGSVPARGTGPSMVDAVADRLHKNRTDARVAMRSPVAARRHADRLPRARAIQRKTAPTRVRVDGAARQAAQPLGAHPQGLGDSGTEAADSDALFGAGCSLEELHCLPSGTRFASSAWISQGGLRLVLRHLHLGSEQPPAASTESAGSGYQYGDILRIDMGATPGEYGQALGMLFILWHEKMASAPGDSEAEGLDAEEDSVLRWIEFSLRYIAHSSRSKPALAQVARRLVDSARDALPALAALTSRQGWGLSLAAAVGLSYAVTVLQLARVIARVRNAAALLGPRAVGEDDDAVAALWTDAQLAAEIDRYVVVLVQLLGASVRGVRILQLGRAEQSWLVLLHAFPGAPAGGSAASAAAVPMGGVWKAVLAACTHGACASSRQDGGLWSAFGYLLQLAQVNVDGVAAPRPAAHLHRPLLQLAEVAVEKGLLASAKSGGGGDEDEPLRPSEEAAIRQTYARVCSIVVTYGMSVDAGSPLYMTLYRFLESRKFRSLSIEPPPSLPRFFTRYSGSIRRESSVADSCTVLWIKSLDASLAEWIAQLRLQPPGSQEHRRRLQVVRSSVSKMLPTRILTFAPSTPSAQLSTLANYYAVFLLFLHAIPSDVVRATRLVTQFQALLRFRDSASQVARRVYFEAWSAAATIVGLRLRRALEESGNVGAAVAELVGGCTGLGAAGRLAAVSDCHGALRTVVGGWTESLGAVLEGLLSAEEHTSGESPRLWGLVDAALMYLHRVLTSGVLRPHAPTVVLAVLEVLRAPPVLELMVWSGGGSAHAPVLHWIVGILQAWQDATSAPQLACSKVAGVAAADAALGGGIARTAGRRADDELADGSDTQMYFAMVDSGDLLEAAAEAEEVERRASFMAADAAAVRIVHEQYVPRLRLHIMSLFMSLSAGAQQELRGQQAGALEATVAMLARMVSVCVDGGLRTWESFLDEHGRDSLHLIPNRHGRRLVLAMFSVAAIDVVRSKSQNTARFEALAKDVWFASVCDLSLTPYVHRLALQLQWMDRHAAADDSAGQAVFAAVPVDKRLLVSTSGVLRVPLGQSTRRPGDDAGDGDGDAGTRLADVYEHRAALAVSWIDSVLQSISQALRGPALSAPHTHGAQRQLFSSWVAQLLGTQRQVQQSAARATHALADTRDLVDTMAERVTLLVRDNCAELFLPPNLMVQPH